MELEEHEIICPDCKGTGDSQAYQLCETCYGKGKLDWVEQVTGREPPKFHGSSTTGYGGALSCHICGTSGVGLPCTNGVTNK